MNAAFRTCLINLTHIAVAMLLLFVATTASAATCVFNTTSGAFNAPGNWTGCTGGNGTPANTPGPADRAEISNATVSFPASTFNLNDLVLSNVTLNGAGLGATTLNVAAVSTTWGAGPYTFSGMNANLTGVVNVNGSAGAAFVTNADLNFVNTVGSLGTTTISGAGARIRNTGSTYISNGDLVMNSGGVFENLGSFIHSGSITINGTFINTGTFNLSSSQTVTLANAAAFSQPNPMQGIIAGDGTISAVGQTLTIGGGYVSGSSTFNVATLVNTGAELRPGNFGIGVITVNGDYVQSGTGAIQINLTGTSPTQYDRVIVSGSVDFNYAATTAKIGFDWTTPVPNVNDFYDIVTFGETLSGNIDFIGTTAGRGIAISYPGVIRATIVSATLDVFSPADSGAGTLRDALTTIQNDSTCLQQPYEVRFFTAMTIAPLSALPTINCTTTITAQFVPGAVPNTSSSDWNAVLPLTLNGTACAGCSGLVFNAPDSVVYGINFINWQSVAVVVNGSAANMLVHGNYFASGVHGVYHNGAPNVSVGQSGNPAARNVFANNSAAAIFTTMQSGGAPLRIENNLIGVGAALATVPNVKAIEAAGTNDVIIAENVIANNTAGIVVTVGTGINYDGNNKIYNNGIGVDLGNDGPTANDELMPPYDTDSGPNQRLNFPTIVSLTPISGTAATVNYQIKTSANASMQVFFCRNPGGSAECEDNTGGLPITTDATGFFSGSLGILGLVPGTPITMFARADSGPKVGNMSEISPGVVFTPGPPIATITGSGAFPATNVGGSSMTQSITIQNTGTTNLNITGLTVTPPGTFIDTSDGPAPSGSHYCGFGSNATGTPLVAGPRLLPPGLSCSIVFIFKPTVAGAVNHTLQFVTNATGSPHNVALTGIGLGPVFSPSAASFTFTAQTVATTSTAQTLTITNTGTASMSILSPMISGPFAISGNTCTGLAPMGSCTMSFTFTPTIAGSATGSVSIPTNAPGSPHIIMLDGTGVAAATPSMTVAFAPTSVTPSTNASMTLTLTNPNAGSAFIGGGSITIPAGLTATPPGSNTCGTFGTVGSGVYSFGMGSIPGSGSCTIVLTVQSPTPGMYTANIAPGALNAGGNNTNTSSATLTVTALLPPTISFAVAPTSIIVGGTSVGTLTINNPNAVPLTANPILFNYLPGLVNAPAPNATSTCVGANITATPGASSYTQNTTFTLPPSGSCTFSATITSGTAGTYSGNIAAGLIVTTAGSSNATPFAITVTAAPTSGVSLAPPTVNFGTRTVNTTSPPTAVTLTNSGTANLIISSVTGSGDFGFTSTCPISTPPVVPAGTCTISITFTPLTAAVLSGAITIVSNAPGSPHTVALSGTGSAAAVPGISLSPTALSFGAQAINTASFIQTVTVTNTGFANLTISGISVAAPFNRAPLGIVTPPDCGATVAPGSSCQIGVTFSPTAIGAQTGQISIIDNAAGSPHTVPLSGTGTSIPVPMISTNGAVNFGDQIINAASTALNLTISNIGTATLNVSAITLTGANATNFAFTGQSGCTTIAPAASCTLAVTFSTTSIGAKAAQINITSNAQNTPVTTVSLSGNGILAPRPVVNLSATVVGYGNVIFGGATPNQIITLTNSGGQAMAIPNMLVTGDFVQVNNCGTSLASLASCTISILFTPLGQGSRFGEFVLTTSAATSPDRIQLSGTGCRWFSQTQNRFFITNCGG